MTTVVVVERERESPMSSFKVLKVQRNNVLLHTAGTVGVIVGRIFELDNKAAKKP